MNKYEQIKVVGEGSFGKAILCMRKLDRKRCIIKQISLAKMSPKEAALTEQEASLLARMSHPGIVAFWESFVATSVSGEKQLYICMEFAGLLYIATYALFSNLNPNVSRLLPVNNRLPVEPNNGGAFLSPSHDFR